MHCFQICNPSATLRTGITKWVLYLSALEEGERIEPERIQRQLEEKDGKVVSLDIIRDVLIRLSRGDLLEYMELGGWFRKVDDPILLDFLKASRISKDGNILKENVPLRCISGYLHIMA